ncbi:MAG: ribosome maturation factor RimM [Cyanobacteria bacterium K_DeepCast_35m_m2_155]|nr:ribosome maturation factor RimM [Cyanobacteria bacterium K_DeepCast_35m_m2_155]
METPPELLVVGKVVAAQGLQGELRILPLSDFAERFTSPGPRWLRGRGQAAALPVELSAGRQLPGKELYVCRLTGINDRNAAEALVGHELLVDAHDRPPLEPGEFHLLDLVGLEVRLLGEANQPIGRVSDLIHAGNDLLEVELGNAATADRQGNGRRILIPFVEAIVPVVELAEGWIGITPPPGLLDL